MNRKLLFWCINLMMGLMIFAQNVGISTTSITPDPSAMLEIRATDKGLLIPRVALTQTTSPSPITNPAVSLLVYNTASVNDVTPGFYYWDGSQWIKLTTGAGALPSWYLNGNVANPSDFIGTTNAEAFRIYTNNTERMRITATGNVGIGTTSPAAQLHTTGTVRFSNYASGASGALLRTNANGDLQITNFSGNATDVLLGNGTFGPVPGIQNLWQDAGNYIYPATSTGASYPRIYDDNTTDVNDGNVSQLYMNASPANLTTGIYVYSSQNVDGVSWRYDSSRTLIKAYDYFGNKYNAAIGGYSWLDNAGSAAIVAARYSGNPRAELATRSASYPGSFTSNYYALKLTGDFYNQDINWGESTDIVFPSSGWNLRDVIVTTHETGRDGSAVWLHAEVDYYKTSTNSFVILQILRDGTALCEVSEYSERDVDKTVHIQWLDEPTPGQHTYTLRVYYPSGGMTYYGHQLHVVEIKR